MKKRKLNWWGLLALLIWFSALALLVYDFIQLTKGGTFTWFGLAIQGGMLTAGCIAEDYMCKRINK